MTLEFDLVSKSMNAGYKDPVLRILVTNDDGIDSEACALAQ